MICPKCHTEYPENTQTCSKCGQALATGSIATGAVAAVPAREVAKAPPCGPGGATPFGWWFPCWDA